MGRQRTAKRGTKGTQHATVVQAPVQMHETYTLTIHALGSDGEGVGRYDGFTVFVPYALPGETVQARMTLVKKQYAVGELVAIVTPSPERVEPQCALFGRCGGCSLQHASLEAQAEAKTQRVRDVIERIAKQNPALVAPVKRPMNPWHYRNKMQMPVGGHPGAPLLGFYARGSHEIIPGVNCAIQQEINNDIAKACWELAQRLGTPPYQEHTGEGVLRHIIGRVNDSGESMVILVTATETLPQVEQWVAGIRKAVPNVVSIVQNVNPKRTNVIMGATNHWLWGERYLVDRIGSLSFHLSPHSFFQVNPEQTCVLYEQALAYADLSGTETVIDAYCGTGTISLFLAQQAKEVLGIEIVEPAVVDARKNAKRNGFTNAQFAVADAAEYMPKLYAEGMRPDVIVFDPIRAGCKESVLTAAVGMEPKRIVYVSCNPASMARDIAILCEQGYRLEKVQPVDLFPHTMHVEAVSLLTRSEATQ